MLVAQVSGLGRNRAGSVAAEFALVIPVFATIAFGALQVGLLTFAYNTMVSIARDDVRAMSVCSLGAEAAKAAALQRLPPWVDTNAWSIVTDTTAPDVSMTISVPTYKAMILNYVRLPLPDLTVKVTMIQEPQGFGGGSCGAASTS